MYDTKGRDAVLNKDFCAWRYGLYAPGPVFLWRRFPAGTPLVLGMCTNVSEARWRFEDSACFFVPCDGEERIPLEPDYWPDQPIEGDYVNAYVEEVVPNSNEWREWIATEPIDDFALVSGQWTDLQV